MKDAERIQVPCDDGEALVEPESGGSLVSPAGAGAVGATLLIPFTIMIAFIVVCVTADEGSTYAMETTLKMTTAYRVALVIHAVYFFQLSFLEVMFNVPFAVKLFGIGEIPKQPNNLFWAMSCWGGELFFVGTSIFTLMATLTNVPRWALLLPISQVSYNLKNDLVFVVLGKYFSPIGESIKFFILDTIIIVTLTAIYLHFFFTAEMA